MSVEGEAQSGAGSFAALNMAWDTSSGSGSRRTLTLPAMRKFPVMGSPEIVVAQTIRYRQYPGNDPPFPLWFFGTLLGYMAWGIYDGAKAHWGTSPISKSWLWLFDVVLLFALLGMGLDTLVTVNGTYLNYGTIEGLEMNGNLRQWAAWVKVNLGVNFAWAMVLTDVLEGMILLISWYYGRKERNMLSLLSMFALGGAHWFAGFASWEKGIWEVLQGLPLFFRQLAGDSKEFQGGGPQVIVGHI